MVDELWVKEHCDFHFLHSEEQKGKIVTKFSMASKHSFSLLHGANVPESSNFS